MDVIQSNLHTHMDIRSEKLQSPSVRYSSTEALTPVSKVVIILPVLRWLDKLGNFSD